MMMRATCKKRVTGKRQQQKSDKAQMPVGFADDVDFRSQWRSLQVISQIQYNTTTISRVNQAQRAIAILKCHDLSKAEQSGTLTLPFVLSIHLRIY